MGTTLVNFIDKLDIAPKWKRVIGFALLMLTFVLHSLEVISPAVADYGYYAGGSLFGLGVVVAVNRRFVQSAVLGLALLFAAQPASALDWKKVIEVKVSILRVEVIAGQMTGIWVDPFRVGCYIPGVNRLPLLGCEPEIVTAQPAAPVVEDVETNNN